MPSTKRIAARTAFRPIFRSFPETVFRDGVHAPFRPSQVTGAQLWTLDNQTTYTRVVNETIRTIDKIGGGDARQMQPGRSWTFAGAETGKTSAAISSGNNISVMCRVRPTSVAGIQAFAGEYTAQGDQRKWLIYMNTTSLVVDVSEDGDAIATGVAKRYTKNTVFSVNTWYTVGFTYDVTTDTLTLYVDGSAVTPDTQSPDDAMTGLHATTSPLLVGHDVNTSGVDADFYNGQIHDIRIFNSVKAASDFATYDAIGPRKDLGDLDTFRHYKCEEASGLVGRDSSGNSDDLTLSGVTHDATNNDVVCFLNEVGYRLNGSVYEPRDESDTANDVTGTALDFTGQNPHDPILNSPCATFDGTADVAEFGDTSVSVTSVKMVIKLLATNQDILTLQNADTHSIAVVGATLTFGSSLAGSNITVDGVSKTAGEAGALLNDLAWHTVTFDLTSVAASDLRVGHDGAGTPNYGNFSMGLLQLNHATPDFSVRFCENAGDIVHDTSGSQNDGVVTFGAGGASAFWANTCDVVDTLVTSGSAIATSFGGTSEEFDHSGAIASSNTLLSIGCWLYDRKTGATRRIVGEWSGGYLLYVSASNNLLFVTGADFSTTSFSAYAGTWTHVACTYNAGAVKIYINNVEVLDDTVTDTSIGAGGAFNIGGNTDRWSGMMSGLVIENAEWDSSTVSAIYNGNVPSSAWHWRDADQYEYNQGVADLTPSGSPGRVIIPQGILPVTVGPGVLQTGQSLDLTGGESNSPYAQQLNTSAGTTTYTSGDDDQSNSIFARLRNNPQQQGDDRIIAVTPDASGSELNSLQDYTKNDA